MRGRVIAAPGSGAGSALREPAVTGSGRGAGGYRRLGLVPAIGGQAQHHLSQLVQHRDVVGASTGGVGGTGGPGGGGGTGAIVLMHRPVHAVLCLFIFGMVGCEEEGSCQQAIERGRVVPRFVCEIDGDRGTHAIEPGCVLGVDCGSLLTQAECPGQENCSWVNLSCVEDTTICSTPDGRNLTDPSACEADPRCRFDEACVVAVTCGSFSDQGACESHSVCEWSPRPRLH